MKKSLLWAGLTGLVLVCVVQWLALFSQIWRYEKVVSEGKSYYFEVRPVDPYDPWRGRYVVLGFEQNRAKEEGEKITESKAYALLEEDEQGRARVKTLRAQKPSGGEAFVGVKVGTLDKEGNRRFWFPFDRFYMEEGKAKAAERWLANSKEGEPIVAEVRVLEGKGVIHELFLGEKRLGDILP
ncbi:GDYXXLXY domain-containing protein [Wolinella succinogenes]|uniref:GDYXXLXY domain-containing protein n=1 Tax=Wolinella succinogenes TaxID=844 RepID=UPI00240A769D|nr:GDYXXLXY domain-containing protein [Wolinella succinogenes]